MTASPRPSPLLPARLVESCRSAPERLAWLEELPSVVERLSRRWSLSLGKPFTGSCAWVAPATRPDGVRTVLKVSMPHYEAEQEIEGLRFWAGDPTVRLLEAAEGLGAMLLERCDPGTPLHSLDEPEQDRVIAPLLRRMWRTPPTFEAFRPLSGMVAHWCEETRAASARWVDGALVERGLRVLEELAATGDRHVLLATDLHAGNVLRARREPWLVIDPKPFVGDPAYDATQHLLNGKARLRADPAGTAKRFAGRLGVDPWRVRAWLFARLAAEPREVWDPDTASLARSLE